MDFAALPPEVNSALMYSGVGSGPMLAAAADWQKMAAELESAAGAYRSVISGLADESWQGPAATAMAAAAAPYVVWMHGTAALCEQAAMQARAGATAYETAFAMTVPPAVVAANRAQLATLVATNFFGQNTPAIMANQAHYAEMWAQDAGAMYTYSGAAAAATTLTPFAAPKQNTNPAALGNQSAGVLQTAGPAAATKTHAALSQLASTVPQTLQGMSQPVQPTAAASGLSQAAVSTGTSTASSAASAPATAMSALSQLPGHGVKHATKAASTGAAAAGGISGFAGNEALGLVEDTVGLEMDGVGLVGLDGGGVGLDVIGVGLDFLGADELTISGGLGPLGSLGALGGLPIGIAAPLESLGALGGVGTVGATSAVVGKAAMMGSLSVPQAWAAVAPQAIGAGQAASMGALPQVWAAAPQVALAAESGTAAMSAAAAGGSQLPYAEMALAGMAGRAMTGATRGFREPGGALLRGRAVGSGGASDDSAPPDSPASRIGIVAELRGLVELRDSGILTEDEFNQQKQRLLEG